MNKVILVGNLTKDPELRTTQSGVNVATFSIAVSRKFKNQNGEYEADFINCVAWRQQGEFVKRYFTKGKKIGVVGSLQTRSYTDKDGNKRTATEVVVDEVEFVGSKNDDGGRGGYNAPAPQEAPYGGNNGGYNSQPAPKPAPAPVTSNDTGFEDFDIEDVEIPF